MPQTVFLSVVACLPGACVFNLASVNITPPPPPPKKDTHIHMLPRHSSQGINKTNHSMFISIKWQLSLNSFSFEVTWLLFYF